VIRASLAKLSSPQSWSGSVLVGCGDGAVRFRWSRGLVPGSLCREGEKKWVGVGVNLSCAARKRNLQSAIGGAAGIAGRGVQWPWIRISRCHLLLA